MSVPDEHLEEVVKMYKKDIIKENLESATWGHIGENHLHVNILPRDNKDYDIGLNLYEKWAKKVTELGGAVSAEHGVGKLKSKYLKVMYGQNHIDEMLDIKSKLDPKLLLSPGNLFEVGKRSE
jgi:D-lactate dehydrogenase (cytochrome)